MKHSLGLLVLLSALLSLGESLKCFSCQGPTASCSQILNCTVDACLTLKAKGGDTYRSCFKYSECEFSHLSLVYSQISTFTFECCNLDLCNSAPVTKASVLIGLLSSLLVMWWSH